MMLELLSTGSSASLSSSWMEGKQELLGDTTRVNEFEAKLSSRRDGRFSSVSKANKTVSGG